MVSVSGPIFLKKWWHFQTFHFPQSGHLISVIKKFLNILKIMLPSLTCKSMSISTHLSVGSALSSVKKLQTRKFGKFWSEILIPIKLKFTTSMQLLYAMGKLTCCRAVFKWLAKLKAWLLWFWFFSLALKMVNNCSINQRQAKYWHLFKVHVTWNFLLAYSKELSKWWRMAFL